MAHASLQAALERQVAGGAPGALARLEAPGWAWSGSAGALARDDPRSLGPDTPFRAASVTKTVTAAVALRLAERGRWSLDDPFASHLDPSIAGRLAGAWDLKRMTPRHALAHTSGVPDYFHAPRFAAALAADPRRAWTPRELLEVCADIGPRFAPGEGFAYSDGGYVLTGVAVEHLTGRPLHEAYRALVLDPAGMDGTYLEGAEPARGPRPATHYRGADDMTRLTPTFDWGGGGLVSTARDLCAFVRALWDGTLLTEESRGQMTAWTPGAAFPAGGAVHYANYGLGLGRNVVNGVELLGHTGFWGAFAYRAPAHDAVLAGTHSNSAVNRGPLVAALCRALVAAGVAHG